MFRFRRQGIDRFGRDSNHDANRIRDTIDTSPRAAWLFSRVSDLLAAGVVGGFGLAAPAAALASVQPAVASVYTMSPIAGSAVTTIWTDRTPA